MSARVPTERAVGAWAAQAAATLALLTKYLGPCELISVLPRRSKRRPPARRTR